MIKKILIWSVMIMTPVVSGVELPIHNRFHNPILKRVFAHSWAKYAVPQFMQQGVKEDDLFKSYINTRLTHLAKKEVECRFNNQENSCNQDCEMLALERLRLMAAYAHQEAHATVKSDNKTYQEIGIPKFEESVSPPSFMGRALLTARLCSPTTDKAVIQDAQSKQQFFECNEEVRKQLRAEFDRVKPGENALLDLWNEGKVQATTQKMEPYRMRMRVLKNSATAGNALIMNTLALKICNYYIYALPQDAPGFIVNSNLAKIYEKIVPNIYNNFSSSLYIASIAKAVKLLADEKPVQAAIQLGIGASFFMSSMFVDNKNVANAIQAACVAADVGLAAHALYEKRASAQETLIHQSLIDAAEYMRSAQKIYHIVQNNPELKAQFPGFCPTYERIQRGEDTQSIMRDLLTTNTFKGSPSAFSNAGRIALVAERLVQAKEEMMPLMKEMGELDAYLAVTEYKKQHASSVPFRYTRPHFKSDRAYIKAEEFVHPGIPNSKPNTLQLGEDQPLTAVVTGPNGCGKSFASKALAANVVISETLGFVQAKEFDHSPVDSIRYSANVKDEVGTKSRYQAEVEAMGAVYNETRECAQNHETALFILDEPLSATNSVGGSTGLEEYIKRVNDTPNNNAMHTIITHHDIKVRGVQHYHVSDGEGKFKLVPGQSTYSNAEKLLRDELNRIDKEMEKRD